MKENISNNSNLLIHPNLFDFSFETISHAFSPFHVVSFYYTWKMVLITMIEHIYMERDWREILLCSNLPPDSGSGEICSVIYSNLLLCCSLHYQIAWKAASQSTTVLRVHTESRTWYQMTSLYAIQFAVEQEYKQ